MADAVVTRIRAGGKGPEGFVVFVISCTYAGADVSGEIEGQSYDTPVVLASGYNTATLRAGIVAAATGLGNGLGLTLDKIVTFAFELAGGAGWNVGLWNVMRWS